MVSMTPVSRSSVCRAAHLYRGIGCIKLRSKPLASV